MSTKSNKSDVGWMYEGQKSSVDAEEYLTGRKVDKHFDQHCSDFKTDKSKLDTVVRSKLTESHPKRSQNHSAGVLGLETIKKEDPLIAIKVKEEQIRREIWENPLKMKRLQKIVMSAMRKKMNKMARKGKLDEFFQIFNGKVSTQPKVEPESSTHNRSSSSDDENLAKSSQARQRCDSDSSNEQKSRRNRSFGLVYVTSPKKSTKTENTRNSVEFSAKSNKKVENEKLNKRHVRRKLTEDEMEAKRMEMMDNAKWREEQRQVKRKKYEAKEEEEERRTKDGKLGATFLKPLISGAMDGGSVEERIRSKKNSIQRRHSDMETNFARK